MTEDVNEVINVNRAIYRPPTGHIPSFLTSVGKASAVVIEAGISQTYNSLRRNLALVSLFEEWEQLKQQLSETAPVGEQLRKWMVRNIPPSDQGKGKTYTSWALKNFGKKWGPLKGDSLIPLALCRVFGHGVLVFLPQTKGK